MIFCAVLDDNLYYNGEVAIKSVFVLYRCVLYLYMSNLFSVLSAEDGIFFHVLSEKQGGF